MNSVILIGNITKDIDIREFGDTKVINNTLAIRKDKDKTVFIDFKAFNGTANILSSYASKGSKICINGELDVEEWQGQDGSKHSKVVVLVNKLELLSSKPKEEEQKEDDPFGQAIKSFEEKRTSEINPDGDLDLPF